MDSPQQQVLEVLVVPTIQYNTIQYHHNIHSNIHHVYPNTIKYKYYRIPICIQYTLQTHGTIYAARTKQNKFCIPYSTVTEHRYLLYSWNVFTMLVAQSYASENDICHFLPKLNYGKHKFLNSRWKMFTGLSDSFEVLWFSSCQLRLRPQQNQI